jgi:hypothetical protein
MYENCSNVKFVLRFEMIKFEINHIWKMCSQLKNVHIWKYMKIVIIKNKCSYMKLVHIIKMFINNNCFTKKLKTEKL